MLRHWKTAVALVLATTAIAGSQPKEGAPATKPAGRTPITLGLPHRSGEAKDAKAAVKGKEPKGEPEAKGSKEPAAGEATSKEKPSEPEVSISDPGSVPAWLTSKRALIEGNARFSDGAVVAPRRDEARRCELAAGQHPAAAILSCADSRVPVELLFDQGIGDLFAVRVAGNVASPAEVASLEYAVEQLQAPLIVVMGHTKCGVLRAAVDGTPTDGAMGQLLAEVRPAADEARRALPRDANANALVSAAVRANVRLAARNLVARSETIASAVKGGRVRVECAVYDLLSGSVQWLEDDGAPLVSARPIGAASASAEGGEGEMLRAASAPEPTAEKERSWKDVKVEVVEPKKPAGHEREERGPAAEAKAKHEERREAEKKESGGEEAGHEEGEKPAKKKDAETAPPRAAATLANPRDRWIVIGSGSIALFSVTASVAQFATRKKNKATAPADDGHKAEAAH